MERREWQRKASKAGVAKSTLPLLSARPERAKALKIPSFCNISVKVLDLHQEIGAF